MVGGRWGNGGRWKVGAWVEKEWRKGGWWKKGGILNQGGRSEEGGKKVGEDTASVANLVLHSRLWVHIRSSLQFQLE